MKKIIKSISARVVLTLAVMLCCLTGARAEELTVYNETDGITEIPVYGYYADTPGTASEFVIPSDELINMAGGTITGLKFYLSSPAEAAWGATIQVYLKEIAGTTLSSFTGPGACTVVYTGTLDATGTVMTVTFITPYIYTGGNLLIGTYVSEAGDCKSATFCGCNQLNNTAWYRVSESGVGSSRRFIPKTTFTYTPDNDKKPSALNLDEVGSSTATLSWTAPTGGGTVTGYTYQYKKITEENWSTEVTVNNTSVTLNGLTAGTAYRFRVKAVYEDDESYYISTTFLTDCGVITTFPWTEDFEGYVSDGKLEAYCWQNDHISGSGTEYFEVFSSTTGSNSTHQLRLHDMASGTKTKLRLPVMTLPDNNYMFVLDVYRNSNYSSETAEGIRVYASANGEIEGATELAFIPRVRSVSNSVIPAESVDGWYTYKLPIPMSGTCYIILRGESQNGASTYMDNFAVKVAPPKLTVSDVTATTANATWTACDGVTSYTIQLASNDQFATGGAGSSVTLFSNDGTDANSAPTGWTYNVSDNASDFLLMFSGHSVVSEAVDASAYTALSVSLDIRTYGGTFQPNLAIQYSTDNGSTWTDAGTVAGTGSTMAQRTLALPAAAVSSALRLRFAPTTTSSSVGVGIKSIVLTGTQPVSLINEYSVTDGTSYTFNDLTPGTTYYVRVKGDDDWSNISSFTTPGAPSWSEFPATTVNVNGSGEITISDYVTGFPAPTITLTSTTANDGEYGFTNGVLTFNPTAVGTYTFTFTATNSLGSADATLTIAVSAAPVTVPDLTVSDVTATTANTTWTACDGVTEYTLQLASDDQFTTGGAGAPVLEANFSDTYGWTLSGTGQYTSAPYYGAGSPSIKFDGTGDYAISPDFGSGVKLQFWAYGNGGSGSTFAISGLVDGDWTNIETVTIAQGGDTYEVNLPNGTSQVRFDFTKNGVNCALDDVVVYGAPGSGSLIAEYFVSDTEYTFTGLTPGTIYYARVKGNAGWANVEEFTTSNVLDGSETLLAAGTYYVNNNITYNHTLKLGNGTINIILADDCTMRIGTEGSPINGAGIENDELDYPDLHIYGQTNDTGSMEVYSTYGIYAINSYTQHGGNVTITGDDSCIFTSEAITINGGSVNANSMSIYEGNITINGGKVTVTGYDISTLDGDIYLGWTNATDYITIKGVSASGGTMVINADGKALIDNSGKVFSGPVNNPGDLNDVTLRPCILLTEGTAEDNTDRTSDLTTWVGQNITTAFQRTFTSSVASTICLPFPMTSITGGDVYGFVGVTYDTNDGWVATMQKSDGNNVTTTAANTPYLFMPSGDSETVDVTFSGSLADVTSIAAGETEAITDDGTWTFQGTYSRLGYGTAPFSGKAYGFAATNGEGEDAVKAGEFVRAVEGASIRAFRAFLIYSGADPDLLARATRGGTSIPDRITVRLIGKDGEIDGIGEISLSTGEVTFDPNAWYDLSGRRLDGKPTKKGVYINNGRKIAIK